VRVCAIALFTQAQIDSSHALPLSLNYNLSQTWGAIHIKKMKLITLILIAGLLAVTGTHSSVAQVIYDPNFRYDGQPRPLAYFEKILPNGMTKEKVVKIMGSPNFEYTYKWTYCGKVLNPTTGNTKTLYVEFDFNWKVIELSTH
jgi:outer membrane protein assembly factor BamE (lipoprotein component of BamABCDE complex)